jgi:signal transduction histidine kinase/ActR/RegA family two-component response regulator
MSLRARLLLLIILAVLPAIGIEIYGEIELRSGRQGEIRQEALRLLRLVAAEQQRLNEGARQLLVAFSEAPPVLARDWSGCSDMANRIQARVEGYRNIGVSSTEGDLLCSALPVPAGRDMRRRSFLEGMTEDGDLRVGTYHIGLITGRPLLTYALPLRDASGAVIAAAWANVDLDWLAQRFADRFPSPNMTLLIADRDGTILLRLPDNQAWVGKPIGKEYMPMLQAAENSVADTKGVDGVERIIAYSPLSVEPKGLYLGVGLAKAPYFVAIDAASRRKAVLVSLSFALALAAAWLGGNAFIRRPIGHLLAAARRWQEGDLSARAGLADRRSEIGKLGQAFDDMAEAVEGRERLRRSAEEALARLNAELEQRVAEEVAEREKAQTALRQAQKIEVVGQLTSGVAHDFNNLLAAVLGNLDLLRGRIADPRGQRMLEGAFRAASRGAKLTEQLLAFSRQRHLEPEPFDINELVRGMSNLLAHTLGPTISVTRQLTAEPWPVLADPGQIEIAVLNIAVNARDAMPLGGTLLIETANLTAGHRRLPAGLAGDFVLIAVSDTGTGMTEAVKARAFEPFYTTKEIGKGTGLGLSMVYGVAKQSGGAAVIDSEPGKGTTVALFLPRSTMAPVQRPAELPPPDAAAPRRGGRVLVVDDDGDVREVTVATLTENGFEVTAVKTGQAALALIEHGTPFDLMIVDYAMPGLTGAEVIARARARRPDIAAILVTGYAEPVLAADLPANVPLLRKPFRVAEIVTRVASALAAATAPPSNVLPLSPPHKRS